MCRCTFRQEQAEWKKVRHSTLSFVLIDVDFLAPAARRPAVAEDDEEAQLRQLQAELAM
jgi:hypothetical protein